MKGLTLDLSHLPVNTPRNGGGGSETFRVRSARKMESLRIENGFTPDVQNEISKIIQNAISCGLSHATIQTLRISGQYSYTFNSNNEEADSFVIHDLYSLIPMENVTAKVTLCSSARDLVNWIREQELDIIVCSRRMSNTQVASRVPVADWINLVVLFIPFKPNPTKQSIGVIFNSQYHDKLLDVNVASATWNKRLLLAQSCGSAYFINAILYVGADFGIQNTQGVGERSVIQPLKHPSHVAMVPDPGWVISERCIPMVAWVSQLGYHWTLSAPSAQSKWAFFIVFLDPLSTYK
jgi:hypothetical protein